ncbi:hypothetical protein [Aquimonas voraii]|uniref:Uncharacterized protein n=1 Tax=Aquimonas voraii TaxID=265719 RepID=A0A1G6SKM8_9GAMM|nr:hypothetical protein [Aquimonas voraii]SDD17398.1 hypothetical protein SAMN04488509_101562 [Aquimonas voraii]
MNSKAEGRLARQGARGIARGLVLAAAALVLVCAIVLVVVWHVRRAPPDSAIAGLIARWQAPSQALGANAFKHLWQIEWDIPESERAAVLAEDRRRALAHAEALLRAAVESAPPPVLTRSADARYPRWPLEDLPQLDCGGREAECLDGFAAIDAEAWRRVDSAPLLSARLAAVHEFGHLRVDDALHFATYLAVAQERTGASRVWLAMAARAFRAGSTQQGLGMACRELATARRFAEGSTHLITRLIESSRILAAAHLAADVLAELPAEAPLPAECEVLTAPLQAPSVSLCAAVGGEYRWLRHSLESAFNGGVSDLWPAASGEPSRLLFDGELSLQWRARAMSWACDQDVLAQMLRGDPAVIRRVREWPADPPVLQCMANPMGCTLDRVSRPDLSVYVERILEEAAALRMLAVLVELRPKLADGLSIEEALAQRKPPETVIEPRLGLQDQALIWQGPPPKRALGLWPVPASRLSSEPAAGESPP